MKSLKILFVEDDPDDRELIRDCLLLNGFHDHLILDSGFGLFSYLEQTTEAALPEIIVVDLNMPNMSGYDVISQLKSHRRYQLIPIFILTTSFKSPMVKKSIEEGAAGYYQKPNTVAELNAILKELCEMAVE